MNIARRSWLGGWAVILIASAAFAQTPAPQPAKAEAKPAAVESTRKVLESGLQCAVLQLEGPLPQNSIRLASSTCPNGGVWGCDYVCKDWDINLRCISWQKINCACR